MLIFNDEQCDQATQDLWDAPSYQPPQPILPRPDARPQLTPRLQAIAQDRQNSDPKPKRQKGSQKDQAEDPAVASERMLAVMKFVTEHKIDMQALSKKDKENLFATVDALSQVTQTAKAKQQKASQRESKKQESAKQRADNQRNRLTQASVRAAGVQQPFVDEEIIETFEDSREGDTASPKMMSDDLTRFQRSPKPELVELRQLVWDDNLEFGQIRPLSMDRVQSLASDIARAAPGSHVPNILLWEYDSV